VVPLTETLRVEMEYLICRNNIIMGLVGVYALVNCGSYSCRPCQKEKLFSRQATTFCRQNAHGLALAIFNSMSE